MAEAHDEPNYMAIFYWLFGLTVAELAVAYMGLPKVLMVGALVGLAIAKAALVAMYFMHLKFERSTLAWIALTPPILLVMFLGITYPDTAWRLFTH
jgi:cytochrome c oxidase subunit IV